jgi:hypothetical protein
VPTATSFPQLSDLEGFALASIRARSSKHRLPYKLRWLPLEPFLEGHAAEMIGFAAMSDLKLGCPVTQDLATNWISGHCLNIDLKDEWTPCFL